MTRRNNERIATEQDVVKSHTLPPEQRGNINTESNTNPFGISFVVPTNVVQLPSRGTFYPKDSPMHKRKSLEIRQMTAKEEDLLTNMQFLKDGTLIGRLLDSIIVDNSIKSKDLIDADINALIVAARKDAYGPEYIVIEDCEFCGESSKWAFDLEKVSVPEPSDKNFESEGIEVNEETKEMTFQLPKSGIFVTIRPLSPEDYQYLEATRDKHKELGLEFVETSALLNRMILSAKSPEMPRPTGDRNLISKLIDVLSPIDARKIKVTHNRALPRLDTTQELTCSHCGKKCRKEVPFSEGFFWPEL